MLSASCVSIFIDMGVTHESSSGATSRDPSVDALPTSDAISHAQSLTLTFSDGLARSVSSIFEATADKVLILIFVRHYHCGMCLQYLQRIVEHPAIKASSKSSPLQTKTGKEVQFIVVGHGSHENIERYSELTGCKQVGIPIYSDESKDVFKIFGVTKQADGLPSKMPEYANGRSSMGVVWDSLKEMAASPWKLIWSGGDFKQLGGEFIFENGKRRQVGVSRERSADLDNSPVGRPTFAHRMVTSADHTEVEDLFRAAAIV